MANKTGTAVLYQPTVKEAANYNNNDQQMAGLITSWDEDSGKTSLVLFPPGASYVVAVGGIVEGVVDGTFQQPGTQSNTAKAKQAQKDAQAKAQAEAQKPAGTQPTTP
jgi:hypothetical protein